MDDLDDLFAEEEPVEATVAEKPWQMLIVDDDESVHQATALVLSRFKFRDRGIQLYHAYSGAEGIRMVAGTPDLALVLLDVVMESDDAGLKVAQAIRSTLGNKAVRIVLRTGQPGQAPAEKVIVDYDINDYREKTELTASRLFTTVVAALRAYSDIMAIEESRRGLRRIIENSERLLDETDLNGFATDVLEQIGKLLEVPPSGLICVQEIFGQTTQRLLIGTGSYASLTGTALDATFPYPSIAAALDKTLTTRQSNYTADAATLFVSGHDGPALAVWIAVERPLTPVDLELLDVFTARMPVSLANVLMFERLKQRVTELGSLVETLETRLSTH